MDRCLSYFLAFVLLFDHVFGEQAKISYNGHNYNSEADTTTFTYEVNALQDFSKWELNIPRCTEVEIVSIIPSIGQGQKQHSVVSYVVIVNGYIKEGIITYTVGDNLVPKSITGPVCEHVIRVSCDAGGPYNGQCGGPVAVSNSKSRHFTSSTWSTTESGASFSSTTVHNPVLTLSNEMCSSTFTITLTLTGDDDQIESCEALVVVVDDEKPVFHGLYATDTTVHCDDIPAPSIVTAKDNCDDNVEVVFTEQSRAVLSGQYTIERTWTATDFCAQSTQYSQIISVVDDDPPTLIGAPDDEEIDCGLLPPPCEVVALDNCDDFVSVQFSEQVQPGTCSESQRRINTWSASDSSGLSMSKSQTVFVVDLEGPTFVGVPDNVKVPCGDVPVVPIVTAHDNCDPDVAVSFDEVTPSAFLYNSNDYTILRTFSSIDNCGNKGSSIWKIVVQDTEAPEIAGIEPDRQANCDEIPAPCEVTVHDNCDQKLQAKFIEDTIYGSCTYEYNLVRSWTVIDQSGNGFDASQTIFVSDTAAPRFKSSIPKVINVNCDFIPVVELNAFDNCGDVSVILSTETIQGTSIVHYSLSREWVATDECGNSNTVSQMVNVKDDQVPLLSGLPPSTFNIACDMEISLPSVIAIDNCPDCVVDLDLKETTQPGSCSNEKIVERQWIGTDCGGNVASFHQIIYVVDTEAPKMNGLYGHVIVSVGNIPTTSVVTATDNCQDITPVFVESRLDGTCLDSYIVLRSWTATDNCGNSKTHFQSINVIDNESPQFISLPEDVTVNCDNLPQNTVEANDNSGRPIKVVKSEERIEGSCDFNYLLVRTITAEDVCGNTVVSDFTITVEDTEPPFWIQTPSSYIHVLQLPATPNLLAVDNCDDVSVTLSSRKISSDCKNEFQMIYLWNSVDACGNAAVSVSQIVDVVDTMPPELINFPVANVSVDCSDLPTPPVVTATDDGEPSIEVTFVETHAEHNCSETYYIIRKWTAQDCVHNTALFVQSIAVSDTTPPSLIIPGDVEVSCSDIPEAKIDEIVSVDDCHKVVALTLHQEMVEVSTPSDYILARSWIASDGCGNSISETQIIQVSDNGLPVISGVPNDQTVSCDIPVRAHPSCSDECDDSILDPSFSETTKPENMECLDYVLVRTWTCEDATGNQAVGTQSIQIRDDVIPTFDYPYPSPIIVECSNIPNPSNLTANDDCDDSIIVTFTEFEKNIQTESDYLLVRTWTINDNCGNSNSIVQSVTVVDSEAPIVTNVPSTQTHPCTEKPSTPTGVVASDNCDSNPGLSVSHEIIPFDCVDIYYVEFSWVATDATGNSGSVQSALFIIDDNKAPSFIGEEITDITVSYTDIPPKLNLNAEDECDPDPKVTCSRESKAGSCAHEKRIIDTCVTNDRCGNIVSVERTIHVIDDVPPPLSAFPEDITIECPGDLPPPTKVVSELQINVINHEEEYSRTCKHAYIVLRTWEAKDCALNVNLHTQTIYVQDTTPPILDKIGLSTTIDCTDEIPDHTAIAIDSCDPEPKVQMMETTINNAHIRRFEAIDVCGNSVEAFRTISIVDNKDPTFNSLPPDTTINHVSYETPTVTCIDSCSLTTIVPSHRKVQGTCDHEYSKINEWTCTDGSGNRVEGIQTVNFVDNTPPTLKSEPPQDLSVEISNLGEAHTPVLEFLDDWGDVVDVDFKALKVDVISKQHYTLVRTWSASDRCSNEFSVVQSILVIDRTPPIIPNVPADAITYCNHPPMTGEDEFLTERIEKQVRDVEVNIDFHKTRHDGSCDDSYTIIRTWIATDLSGNAISDSQKITVLDPMKPTFDQTVPPHTMVDCDQVPDPPTITGTDSCGGGEDGSLPVSVGVILSETNENDDIIRSWTITDKCGNEDQATQTIQVTDLTPPQLSSKPSDETKSCSVLPLEIPHITATDNCDSNIEVTFKEEKDDIKCAMTYKLLRTWTATDSIGKIERYTQTIQIQDNEAPTIDGPDDVIIDCANSLPETPTVNGVDSCFGTISTSLSVTTFSSNGVNGKIRHWIAEDNCGNAEHHYQTIKFIDDIDPTISQIPSSITVPCDSIPPTPNRDVTDNCDTSPDMVLSSLKSDGPCPATYAIVTTWSATDKSGNIAHAFQTMNVEDTSPPKLLEVPSMLEITVSCNSVPIAPIGVVQDDCDAGVDVEYDQQTLSGTETHQYRLVRIWKAEDDCGNSVKSTQTIYVLKDSEAPVFVNIPIDEQINCGSVVPAYTPYAVDNCDSSITSISLTVTRIDGTCSSEWRIIRTWTASDSFGNIATVDQIVTVVDNEPPSLTVPPSMESSCDDVPEIGHAFATDSCDRSVDIRVEEEKKFSDESVDRYTILRIWTATDGCGNSVQKDQQIIIDDTTKPIFGHIPSDAEDSCEKVDLSISEVQATDNCANEVNIISHSSVSDYVCISTRVVIHTWVASDNSGNSRTAFQTITIFDRTAPVFDASELLRNQDTTVGCVDIPSSKKMIVTDNCQDDVSVSMMEDTIFEFPHFVNVRSWSAEDNCGNKVLHIQTVTISDNTAPFLTSVPGDITIECKDNIPFFYVRANDICDPTVTVSVVNITRPGSCADSSTIAYTWSSTDVSGNIGVATATIFIEDTIPPVLVGLPSLVQMTYECDNIPPATSVTATDNCDGSATVVFSSSDSKIQFSDIEYEITRTWSATDRCGNSAESSRILVIKDEMSPILSCSTCDELFVGCDHIHPVSTVTVSDNCDSFVSVEFDESREHGSCSHTYTIIRSWSSFDHSGNSASITQNIFVVDNVSPVLSGIPADEMRECDNLNSAPSVTAVDNCETSVSVSFEESFTDQNSQYNYKIVRSWTVTDSCGLSDTGTQTTQVVDTQAPTFSHQPNSVSVEIDAVKSTWPGTITATDNCDADVPTKFSQLRVDGSCRHAYTLIRTWLSTDSSGNVAEHHQTVVLNDYTSPLLEGVPDDMVIDFEQRNLISSLSSVLDHVTASDNSGIAIVVSGKTIEVKQDCGSLYRIIRTFLAEDNCGNEVTQSQTIQVVDKVPPRFNEPVDETVECDAIPKKCKVEILANPDHPDFGLDISSKETKTSITAPNQFQLIRTWWVDDCAGNRASYSQTVTVQDTTPPVLSRLPRDQTSECTCEDSQGVDVEGLDNCDLAEVIVTMDESTENDYNSSPDNFITYRTWIATDTSGNHVSHTQTLTVTDSIAPEFCQDTPAPANSFVQCDAVPPPPDLKFNDNCDPNVGVEYSQINKGGDCDDNYALIRTWIASDRTGNSISHSHTIQVSDDEEPTLLTGSTLCLFPANGRIAVYEKASERLIEAIDNCGDVTVYLKSCNSSQPETDKPVAFPSDCAYNSFADTLYVRIERNDQVVKGRYYRLWVSMVDACGNHKLAKKTIWIPYDQQSYDSAKEEDNCGGTGADHYISSLPNF